MLRCGGERSGCDDAARCALRLVIIYLLQERSVWFDVHDVDVSAVSATPSVAALNACLRNLDLETSPRRLCELVWFVLTFGTDAERQLTVCYGTSHNVGARGNYRLQRIHQLCSCSCSWSARRPVGRHRSLCTFRQRHACRVVLHSESSAFYILTHPESIVHAISQLSKDQSELLIFRVAVRLANSGVACTVCLIFVKYCSVMMPRMVERVKRAASAAWRVEWRPDAVCSTKQLRSIAPARQMQLPGCRC